MQRWFYVEEIFKSRWLLRRDVPGVGLVIVKSGLCEAVCALYMEVCWLGHHTYEHMLDKSWLAEQTMRSEPAQTESRIHADSANHKGHCTSTHEGSHGSFPDQQTPH